VVWRRSPGRTRCGEGRRGDLGTAAAATAATAPTPSKGDTAWMLTSTAFVLLMSVPALALFYGGLVRQKHARC